jgi:hypothetical protein
MRWLRRRYVLHTCDLLWKHQQRRKTRWWCEALDVQPLFWRSRCVLNSGIELESSMVRQSTLTQRGAPCGGCASDVSHVPTWRCWAHPYPICPDIFILWCTFCATIVLATVALPQCEVDARDESLLAMRAELEVRSTLTLGTPLRLLMACVQVTAVTWCPCNVCCRWRRLCERFETTISCAVSMGGAGRGVQRDILCEKLCTTVAALDASTFHRR